MTAPDHPVFLAAVEPTQAAVVEAITALADTHKSTLGYIPWGAWPEFAAKGGLLAALDEDGSLLGYALFDVARGRVRLIQLCTAHAARGQGVSRRLVDAIAEGHNALRGIVLKCRPEFEANKVWPKLGFVPVNEVRGRSSDGKSLTVWFRDNNNPDLFSLDETDPALIVAMDHNVFLDLCVDRRRAGAAESQALESDWLRDQIRLLTTPETFQEINQIPAHQSSEKQRQRAAAISFGQLVVPAIAARHAADRLRSVLGSVDADDESDFNHVAQAGAAGASVLVTRDDEWIKKAGDAAAAALGVRLLRPSDLVVHLDELQNAARYRPAALRGTQMSLQSVPAGSEQRLADLIDKPGGETRSEYNAALRAIAAEPRAERLYLRDADGAVLAAWAIVRYQADQVTKVPFFRVSSHPLAETIASQIFFGIRHEAAGAGSTRVQVTDRHIGRGVAAALVQNGYEAGDDGYTAHVLPVTSTSAALTRLPHESRIAAAIASVQSGSAGTDEAAAIEHALWPAKLLDAALPNYLIPIKPRWADDLLGLKPALWDPPSLLGASAEHVYYRYARGNPPGAARILWYVSAQPGRIVQQVAACSLMLAVDVGHPARLFRRYQHLGVYALEDVRRAGAEQVAALRFADTELLNRPIAYTRLKQLAAAADCQLGTIQSPTLISRTLFENLYREARQPWTSMNGQS